MDPPLINEESFSTANPSLAEIWPLAVTGVHGGGGGGAVGLRMGNGRRFGQGSWMVPVDSGGGRNRDGSIDGGSTVTEQSGDESGDGGGRRRRRRRRDALSEDESSKLDPAIISGNELVCFIRFHGLPQNIAICFCILL
ncbi:hypothetical protein Dimus_004827 [Dionaea muscipula]